MRHKLSTSPAFSAPILRRAGQLALMVTCLFTASACAPKLGDGCERDTECSVNRDRICDRSQPGGYCTLADCSSNSCPDDGVCVRFQPDEPRLARSWCMAECSSTRDCDRDRYVCRTAAQINREAQTEDQSSPPIAVVLDSNPSRKFCVVNTKD